MAENNIIVNVEEINTVQKKITFDIPWLDVSKELDVVYSDMGRKARVKGFRPGRIPRKILESLYKSQAEEEAISNLVNRFYWDAIKDNDIEAVAQPVIDQKGIELNKDFNFTATVEVEPKIEPKEYTGIEVTKDENEVTVKDVEARLQQIREMYGTLEEVQEDRSVVKGDFATIDFEGFLDDKAVKEMKSDGYFLEVGSGTFTPGFEDQLIGMKKGENRRIAVKFPDDYHSKDAAGKDVIFSVDLKGIREKKLPELNEDFIKNFEKYENLEAFKDDVRKSIEEANVEASESLLKDRIIEKLLENNQFEVPPSFVERQTLLMMADMQKRFEARGMERKAAAQMSVKYHSQLKEQAEKVVKSVLLLKKIADKENITIGEEDTEQRIRKLAEERGVSVDSVKDSLAKEDMLESLNLDILHEKVFSMIKEKAKISIVKKNTDSSEEIK